MSNSEPQGPVLDNDALRKGLGELRSKLEVFDAELGQGQSTPENVRAVEQAANFRAALTVLSYLPAGSTSVLLRTVKKLCKRSSSIRNFSLAA